MKQFWVEVRSRVAMGVGDDIMEDSLGLHKPKICELGSWMALPYKSWFGIDP